jgi:hypothetical protein
MATRTAGAKVVLDGENEYKQALTSLNDGNRVLASEMKKLQAEYKGNSDSVEFLTKKGDLLNRQLLDQKEKVEVMRQALENAAKKYGEGSAQAMKWQTELNNAEAAQYNLQHAIEENNQAIENQGNVWGKVGGIMEDLAGKMGIKIPDGAKKALSGMEGMSAGTVAAMTAAVTAVAALVKAVTELHEMTIQTAADVDELVTNSMTTGIATKTLQEMKYAEELIDVSVDTISGSLTRLTRNMADANSGSEEMAAKFAALGVSITDATTGQLRPAEDVFYELIDALGNIQNQTERDAVAMDILGKSAQELNPLILQGSKAMKDLANEAAAAGYVLDESQIKKLAEVDDSYQRVQLTMEALRKQMSADFAPASKEAMDLFSNLVTKAGAALERSGLITNLASIISSLVDILETGADIASGIPGFNNQLSLLKVTLGAVAQFVALIADAADVVGGLFQVITGSGGGRMAGLERIGNAMGFGESSGTLSHYKTVYMQQSGTYDQYQEFHANMRGESTRDGLGFDTATGQYYDLKTGNYVYGHNAGGTENWRGGLTWVGEAGPELALLPKGTQIMSNQESRTGGDTFYITIDAKNVQEFNDIIRMAKEAPALRQKR